MKQLHILIGLLLAATGNCLMAQEISVYDAENRAIDFLSNQSQSAKRAKGKTQSLSLSLAYTSQSEGKTCFYVFNAGEDEGFVIVGGDEAAREILGYCDHGSFDYETAPENFKWWLGEYTKQIAHAELSAEVSSSSSYSAPRRAKANKQRDSIGPLIKTKWNQGYPYNSEIPVYSSDGQPFLTGCVATSMAQVMNYWKYPEQGVGSHSWTWENNEFTANFGETTYDWEEMLFSYGDEYTDAQAKAVGTLMYQAGVSVDMQYGTLESAAYFENIAQALVDYFKYEPYLRQINRTVFIDEQWEDLVYNELKAGRPVLYSGSSPDESHAFICDGYDSDNELFTINWGWGGHYDGCFPLSGDNALQPGNRDYSQSHFIYINVQPSGMEYNLSRDHLYCNELTFYKNYSSNDHFSYDHSLGSGSDEYYLSIEVANRRSVNENFDLGVKAIETATGIIKYWICQENLTIPINSFTYKVLVFDPYDLDYNGTYELIPVCRVAGSTEGDWKEMDLRSSLTIPTLTITGATDPDPVDISFSIDNYTLEEFSTLQIEHNSNYTGSITYSSSNPSIATVNSEGLITGVSPGEVSISAMGEAQGNYKATTKRFNITVTKLVKKDVKFTINKTNVKTGQTLQISWDNAYDGVPSFSSSDKSKATVDANGLVTGVSEGTVTIYATAPATTFFNREEVQFKIVVTGWDIVFTQEPYFNNDNNPYEDDMYLYYTIKNATTTESELSVYYQVTVGSTIYSGRQYISEVEPDYEVDMELYLGRIIENCTPNTQYTIYFFKDADRTDPFNFPSITFTYRDQLSVDYTMDETGYGTLILPFNEYLPEGMTIYGCTDVDDNDVLTLTEDNSIKRNVPYIVKATPGSTDQFVGPEASDDDKPSFTNGILVGAVTNTVPLVAGTDYIMQEQNGKVAFFKYTGTPSSKADENDSEGNRLAKPFRAFLRLDGPANAKLFLPGQFGDDTVGIEEISNDDVKSEGIYSIDGKRRATLQKGLNVIILDDGTAQKVIIK